MKYSRGVTMKDGTVRSETWEEITARNKAMHLKKYASVIATNSSLKSDIDDAYKSVLNYEILPSMRSMQFGGTAIERNEARMYNCGYIPISSVEVFSEIVYLLLCGVGIGYSVQKHHVAALPSLCVPQGEITHYIGDSIEGWADAVRMLIESFTKPGSSKVIFKGDLVRKRGTLISSVQRLAPGPEPLLRSLGIAREILMERATQQTDTPRLRSIDVMDIVNVLSECASSGGIRRSALVCLFSPDDQHMLHSKDASQSWWRTHPWRCRSNNSAVILRGDYREKRDFEAVWKVLRDSGSGEPGFYFTNDTSREWGTNPCVETALRPAQFCNLTEINAATVSSQSDFERRSRYATLLGTLQAGYTSFSYLRPQWRDTTTEEALLGVGLTGIANGAVSTLDVSAAAHQARLWNAKYAASLGINPSARLTCVKPSGTTSLVLGCGSGVHGIHSPHYIRRIRIGKDEPLYQTFLQHIPALLEDEFGSESTSAVVSIPVATVASPRSFYRTEKVGNFLETIKHFNEEWIGPGHVDGINRHNVSATISVRPDEWDDVRKWLWDNRRHYTGLAFLPYDGGLYKQAPFEECDAATYNSMATLLEPLTIERITHTARVITTTTEENACAGGACEL